ncbi:MAG: cytochrome o ubiquinol oxidase subunit III [Porphyromonadaceae bacterium]|nr:cytochrome o ubiquinol oxidase subunit III [Porphyromonadaceae bacterium]
MNTTDINKIEELEALRVERQHHAEINTFGLWIYLMSDLIMFSILFATFVVLGKNVAGGATPQELFHLPFIFTETMFLLLSSVTFGLSMVAMNNQNKKAVLIGLIATGLFGLGFLVMELYEFYELAASGNTPDKSGFLTAFFTLVGTHGAHVFFGLIWLISMIIQVAKKGFSDKVRSRLVRLSIFWHFLDVVWVGVFTFVYLMSMI